MSIVQNPITGRTYGKFGTAIFSKNFQKNVMRSKPIEVRDAKSELQLNQRQAFTTVQEYLKARLPFFRETFLGQAVERSAFSCAMSANLPACLTGTAGAKTVNRNNVEFGGGSLEDLGEIQVITTTPGMIQITWVAGSPVLPAMATDKVSFILESTDDETMVKLAMDAAQRSSGSCNIVVADGEELLYNIVKHHVHSLKYKAGSELASKVK